MQVQSLGQEDPLEKDVATHSSVLAWKIPWTEEPGRLVVHSVAQNWTQLKWLSTHAFIIFGAAGSSLLCGLFSSCGEQGYSLVTVCRLPAEVASLIAEHRALVQELWCSGLVAPQHSDQGSNLCPHTGSRFFTTEPQGEPWIDLILNSGM